MRGARVVVAGAVSLVSGTTMGIYGYTAAPVRHHAADPGPAAVQGLAPAGAATPPPGRTPAPQTGAVTSAATPSARPRPSATTGPVIARAQVLERARTWHPHTAQRVPYSQLRSFGGYRTDCSGYVSMALNLGGPGPITVGLASPAYSTPIPMSALRPGDLVIDASGTNNTRHAVIFVRWTSGSHAAYWEYEQRGGYGTDYRTRTYGLEPGSEYHAYRPKKIR
jgi:cell wall-associated NlpC family hydrolase